MEISLIASAYDLGRGGAGMARGPERYLEAGVADALSDKGFEVTVSSVKRESPFEHEMDAVAEVNARLAELVEAADARKAFPLVLGGNCDSALGTLAGVGTKGLGIIWFDAHGDFNTPETSTSASLAGMPVAIVTGRCHGELWSKVGGGEPVPDSRVMLIGVRDLDTEERSQLESSDVAMIEAARVNEVGVNESLDPPLDALRSRVDEVYLHLDMDSLDPGPAPGVSYPTPGGLRVEDMEHAIRTIAQDFHIRAASLSAYNLDADQNDKTLRVGMHLAEVVAEAVATPRTEVRNGC